MIKSPSFWEEEEQAPILNCNHTFLIPGSSNDEAISRAERWVEVCGADEAGLELSPESLDFSQVDRILVADAERTFVSDANRRKMVAISQHWWQTIPDYHQGLGYIIGFLSLFLSPEKVAQVILRLEREEKFTPGYFRGRPETFVRDAKVFGRLIEEHLPEISQHLTTSGVVPDAYSQKWFVGLCIHVLPFEVLFEFLDTYFELGHIYLFQFAVTLVRKLSTQILSTSKTNVNGLFSLLRLDAEVLPVEENIDLFRDAVQEAKQFELSTETLQKLREEEWEKLQVHLERVRQLEQEDSEEEEFDDESESED